MIIKYASKKIFNIPLPILFDKVCYVLLLAGFFGTILHYKFSAFFLSFSSIILFAIGRFEISNKIEELKFNSLFQMGIFFLSWSALSIFWADQPKEALSTWYKIFGFLLSSVFFIYFSNRLKDHLIEYFFKMIFMIYLFALIFLTCEYIFNFPFVSFLYDTGINDKTSVSHMQYCLYKPLVTILSLLFPSILIFLLRYKYNIYAFFFIFLLYGLSFFVIFFANALSATIGFMLGGALFLISLFFYGHILKLLKYSILLVSVFLPILTGPFLTKIYELGDFFPRFLANLYYRLCVWHFTASKFFERPFLGWGLGGSKNIEGGNQFVADGIIAMPVHPHNNILQIFLELGIPGALIALGFLLFVFSYIKKKFIDRVALSAALFFIFLAYVVSSMSFSVWHMWYLSWLVMAFQFMVLANKLNIDSEEDKKTDYPY